MHERWIQKSDRDLNMIPWPKEWRRNQCGECRFWCPLAGQLGLDWGVCANPVSKWDGTARFEHDGCEHFVSSGEWATPDSVR
ncbi:DUF3027 domain-containing protein [Lentzea aerocolonigenes]|nr:DUF3027 domain-containing protein [Lentzea aerocolonigenes]